jgi:uncharacterized protein (TIGR03435 family)
MPSATEGDVSIKPAGQFALRYEHVSLDRLATMLGPPALSYPVVNRTGLAGTYDFTLDLQPYIESAVPLPNGGLDLEPVCLQALPRQLGLKVVKRNAQAVVLVIDRVNRNPSDN